MGPEFALDGSVFSPLRIRLIKLQLALLEVSIPFEALKSAWTEGYRNSWGMKLYSSTTAEELLQILTLLESSIRRDYLSSKFETTSEVLPPSNLSDYSSNLEAAPVLPWIPKTTAAVALRLMEFDAAISYTLNQRAETQRDKGAGEFMLPSKYAVVKNHQADETMQTPNRVEYLQEADVGIGFSGSGRGLGRGRGYGVTRGGRSQRRPTSSRSGSGKRTTTVDSGRLRPVLEWKSRSRGQGGCRRSKRRPKVANRIVEIAGGERENPKEIMGKSSRSSGMNAWNGDEVTRLEVGTADNARSSESSEYNDENGQATGDEYDYLAVDEYAGGFNGKADDGEGSDYNIDGDEGDEDDDLEDRDEIAEEEQGNFNVGGYINENSDEEGIRDGDDLEDSDPCVKPYGYSTETSSDFSE